MLKVAIAKHIFQLNFQPVFIHNGFSVDTQLVHDLFRSESDDGLTQTAVQREYVGDVGVSQRGQLRQHHLLHKVDPVDRDDLVEADLVVLEREIRHCLGLLLNYCISNR